MSTRETSEKSPSPRSFTLPNSTIFKILFTILCILCLKILASLLMTLFLSTLVAVSLNPMVTWLQKRKMARWLAITIVTVALTGLIVGIASLILPKIFQEVSNFVENLPKLRDQALSSMPSDNLLRPFLANLNRQAITPKPADIVPIFNAGNLALDALTECFLIFVFSIYLIIDGPNVMQWFLAFFSAENQVKIKRTADEVSDIIFAYVAGHVVTSVLSFLYVLICLSILHVPNVLLLAALAGILDVLPVLGFFLAVIPALLFAVPISGTTGIIVIILYILFHAIENYFVVPAIYGRSLRVSGFIVLATLIASYMLAGVEGAIAVLPVVASYPIVERIWLRRYVGTSAIHEHAKVDVKDPT